MNNPSSRPKGRFVNGTWHCNCIPRTPASHFQVKKDTPNKGRWFYNCAKEQGERCGFFLWREDAAVREEACLLENSRTEEEVPYFEKKGPLYPISEGERAIVRRLELLKKGWLADDDEDRPLTQDESAVMMRMAEREAWKGKANVATGTAMPSPASDSTPAHSGRGAPGSPPKTMGPPRSPAAGGTPSYSPVRRSSIGYPGGLQDPTTPSPLKRKLDFTSAKAMFDEEAETSPSRRLKFTGTPGQASGNMEPPVTPSPAMRLQAMKLASSGGSSTSTPRITRPPDGQDYDITKTVLTVLEPHYIDAEISEQIQETLNQYALRVSGIEKGRDITRVALKAKDQKIEELQETIRGLEQERELDKTVIRHLRGL